MTAPTTTPSDGGFYRILALLHGHRCPMSILGARIGLAARHRLDELGCLAGNVHLSARYYHATCALDGIQLATNCTLGNGNLAVDNREEHRLVLWVQESGRWVEARLAPEGLEAGRGYGALRRRASALSQDSEERWTIEAQMNSILDRLEVAPEALLVNVVAGAEGEACP